MKILALPDSFKGTLSSIEVGNIIKDELSKKSLDVTSLPFADGGEGTLFCFEYLFPNSKRIYTKVKTPDLKSERITYYLIDNSVAIIESALAIPMNKEKYPDQLRNSSYALGELILDAINRGIKDFIIALGGVCTSDYGTGMLKALGMSFIKDSIDSFPYAYNISSFDSYEYQEMKNRLKDCHFKVLCDIDDELFNEKGAALYYSRQKGASLIDSLKIEEEGKRFISKLNFTADIGKKTAAAGGLGFAFKNFLNANLLSGAEEILSLYTDSIFENVDYVITGEGKSDSSSFDGKAISILLSHCKQKSKTILLSGYISEIDRKKFIDYGFYDAISIQSEDNIDIATLRKMAKKDLRKSVRNLKL